MKFIRTIILFESVINKQYIIQYTNIIRVLIITVIYCTFEVTNNIIVNNQEYNKLFRCNLFKHLTRFRLIGTKLIDSDIFDLLYL